MKTDKPRRALDRSRDFGEVFGLSGCRYVQDGFQFNAGGLEITPDQITHFDDERTPPSGRDDTPIHIAFEVKGPEPISSTHENGKMADALDIMDWKKLKAMVESYGGTWVDRESAVEYLKGMSAS